MADDRPAMKASAEEMRRAKIDLAYRDYCAHMLIPLNKCRHNTLYLPFKCEHERHAYEKCQYIEHLRLRAKKMDE